ncbi:MAG: tetratricopeptide repeat protein [Prevotellaceae bacterium]|nr:tetratricopeptide repeat protein [Prevotellaceae bacterium]
MDEGIVRFPDEFYYLGMKINYLIDNGHVQQAIDYLQQAIERDPTKAQYYNVMGNLYSNIGKRIEAMRNYDKAIELEPQNADFLVSKASSIYSEAKEMETAALTTRDPKTAEMLNVTARAKFKEAVNYFHKALELDENNSEALQSLKGYYFKINDMKKYNEFDAKIKAL